MSKKITVFSLMLVLFCLLSTLIFGNVYASELSIYHHQFSDYIQEETSLNTEDFFVDILLIYSEEKGFVNFDLESEELYLSNSADFVLAYCSAYLVSNSIESDVFDKYYIINPCLAYPYDLGYHILTPEDGKIYTLRDAYDSDIKGVKLLFSDNIDIFDSHSARTGLIGDVDLDGALTIKDGTEIQKCIAGVSGFSDSDLIRAFEFKDNPPLLCVSDFNRDGERNIKDATAIQKHIAGLEY